MPGNLRSSQYQSYNGEMLLIAGSILSPSLFNKYYRKLYFQIDLYNDLRAHQSHLPPPQKSPRTHYSRASPKPDQLSLTVNQALHERESLVHPRGHLAHPRREQHRSSTLQRNDIFYLRPEGILGYAGAAVVLIEELINSYS